MVSLRGVAKEGARNRKKEKIRKKKNPGCHLFSSAHVRQKEWKLMNRNGTLVGGIRYLEPVRHAWGMLPDGK